MSEPIDREDGYDEWLDAIAADEGYYLACGNGHGSLPPRRACPVCGDLDLEEEPLSEPGEVVTFTVVHVPTPQFEGEAPYVTAIAEFGPARVTGIVREMDPGAVETGLSVRPDVEEADGERRLVFRPASA
jgi:uncharacterized OB-fold protein